MNNKITKKKLPGRRLRPVRWKNFFLISKLCLVLTLLTTFPVSADVYSQGTMVTLEVKSSSLADVLTRIKDQTGVRILYNVNGLNGVLCKNISLKSVSVEEALRVVLKGTGFRYTEIEGVYVIKENRDAEQKSVTLKGFVRDVKRNTLPGVTVRLAGTTVGTSTDTRGWFRLTLPVDSGRIEFSFVGYKKQTLVFTARTGQDTLQIRMEEEVQGIDEVVVTGYGNVGRGNYTGAATVIQAEDILMPGVTSLDQMLQGVVPGMLVMNQTGLVGASPKIRVRGTSTLLGSQEPVWVVDGVIQHDPQPFNMDDNTKFTMDADDISKLAGNAISWLNPNDIESITVLKDASATAIYGSQAANGVIVITTKKAQAGRVQVSYSGDFTIGQRPRYGLYDLMNSAERMQFSKEMYESGRKIKSDVSSIGFESLLERYRNKEATIAELREEYEQMSRQNTDWFDILFRNSFNHSHSLSISGGSDKIQNRTSFNYSGQNGEAIGNGMTQFSVNSSTTVNLNHGITANFMLSGSTRDVEGFAYGVDPFSYAYNTTRVIPCYAEDGSLYYYERKKGTPSGFETNIFNYNILNEEAHTGSENKTRTWSATVDLKWKIFPWLEYQGLFGYSSSSSDTKKWASERSFYITNIRGYEYGTYTTMDAESQHSRLPQGGLLETSLTNTATVNVRNSLVYDDLLGEKHRLTFQLGIETSSTKTKGETNRRYGYLPDRGETFVTPPLHFLNANGTSLNNTDFLTGDSNGDMGHTVLNRLDNKLSGYGMAVYAYDNRYVFNASARVDASNRFGQDKNKRFQPTWSVGLKWRLADEPFIGKRWWFNNLDIYGSYGYQGNAVQGVSPELITQYSSAYNGSIYTQRIESYPSPDLGWEKTKTLNLGVDGSFLEGRLNFTFNYFKKRSYVLSERAIPQENGVTNGIVGGTLMTNDGYDLVVSVVPVRVGDFSWQLSVNTSVTNNSVKTDKYSNTWLNYANGTAVLEGVPFSTFYSFMFTGLDEEYGQPMFKNMTQYSGSTYFEKEEVENLTDIMEESGKFTPDFTGGFNMMFKYKNISLYALFAVQWGGAGRIPSYDNNFGNQVVPRSELNVSRELIDRWKQPGDKTSIPSLPGGLCDNVKIPDVKNLELNNNWQYRIYVYNYSNARVANTDFIRCRQLSLNYDFQGEWMKKAGLGYLSLKASMTNPFMWVRDKKWNGLDPETCGWPTRRVSSLSLQVMF